MASTSAIGAGLIIHLQTGAAEPASTPAGGAASNQITPWIRIAPDDTVTVYLSQTELGQGISTGLMQMLADELDADWGKIRIERAPIQAPFQITMRGRSFQGTFAGTSTALIGPPMRNAGAAAREMLMQAGANAWALPPGEVTTDAGWVVHKPTGRKASYGSLADAAAKLPVPEKPTLKKRADYRYIGKPMKRLDTASKTNGSMVYGIDIRVPGMLYGYVVHAPVIGSKITGSNADVLKSMPGVIAVVPVPDALVVVADSYWHAKKAAGARSTGMVSY